MVDATPLDHQLERGELVRAKEKASLLATGVVIRLESAITSKRALVPKERTATTYMNGSETSPLPLNGGGKKGGNQRPFFARGTCKFGDACRDKHGGDSNRSPSNNNRGKGNDKGKSKPDKPRRRSRYRYTT